MVAALVLIMGEDKAFDYLKKLNPSIQTYTQSGTAPSKAAAIGQAGVGIQFTPAFLQFIGEGYPLKVTFPKEGVGFEAPAISILKGAPHVEPAKKLLDWFISLPGQNALTDAKTYFFPVHPKAKLMARACRPSTRSRPSTTTRSGPGRRRSGSWTAGSTRSCGAQK